MVYEIGRAKRNRRYSVEVMEHSRRMPGRSNWRYSTDVSKHYRQRPTLGDDVMYTGPAIPTNGNHVHKVPFSNYKIGAAAPQGATYWDRDWEIGMDTAAEQYQIGMDTAAQQYQIGMDTAAQQYEIGFNTAAPQYEIGAMGRVKYWVKDDFLYGCAEMRGRNGACLLVSTRVPLAPIRKAAARILKGRAVEMGWNPFKSISKAAKSVSKSVGKFAKDKVARNLWKVAKNPTFQKIAMASVAPAWYASYKALQVPAIRNLAIQAAPMAGAAFGVPPHITAMATGVLQQAMAGDQSAISKVQNIAQQAAQGYPPAQQLQQTMSMMYRGGMKQYAQGLPMPPQFQMPQMPTFPWQQQMQQYQQQAQQQIQQYQQQAQQLQQRMQQQMPQLPYGIRLPFAVPQPGGFPPISGWVYNVPYRGNLAAKALDKTNPLHIIRRMYSQGSK